MPLSPRRLSRRSVSSNLRFLAGPGIAAWLGIAGLTGLAGLAPRFAIAAAAPGSTEQLVLRNAPPKTGNGFLYAAGVFHTPGGKSIPRDQVRDWWLSTENAKHPGPLAETASSAARAKTALEKLRAQGRALAAKYPGAKGVIILDDGRFQLTPEHHHLYRYHFAGLILNESLLGWSKIELGFTKGRSRRRILMARCLTRDGRLHVLDPATIRVSRPGSGTVFFDPNSRMMSAVIPGVGVGSVVEYIYDYEAYAPEDWRLFFPSFTFQSDLPVCRSIFRVLTPAGVPLYWWTEHWDYPEAAGRTGIGAAFRTFLHRLQRPGRRSRVRSQGRLYTCWTWERDDVPPLIQEPRMPPESEITPAVFGSIMKRWDHLNRLTGGMQRERMKATPAIQAKVKELTAGLSSREAKVARLYHWVQKNIRYISIKSSLSSGWSGHPAGDTFANGYGDCTDKSILFATMLHEIGVQADPVVLRTNDRGVFIPKYPFLACNHCITELWFGKKHLFLDCTTQDHRYPSLRADDHGVLAIDFIRGTRTMIPVPPGRLGLAKTAHNAIRINTDGSIQVHTHNQYAGMYEAALRAGWKRVPIPLRRQMMQQYLNGLAPGAHLEKFTMPDPQDLDHPFYLDFTFRLPAYLIAAGDIRIFQVPDREQRFPEISLVHRHYALVYPTSQALTREVEITVPPGLRLVDLPPPVNIRGWHVRYTEKFTRSGKRCILFHSRFERSGRRIPVSRYASYRRALQKIAAATRKPVYFELARQPGAAPSSGGAALMN